jgi:hypothetical protein
VETPRKFITAKLSIRKPGSSSVLIICDEDEEDEEEEDPGLRRSDEDLMKILCTDEDPGLRIESFTVINLRGVSTNKTIICFIAMQTYKELIKERQL